MSKTFRNMAPVAGMMAPMLDLFIPVFAFCIGLVFRILFFPFTFLADRAHKGEVKVREDAAQAAAEAPAVRRAIADQCTQARYNFIGYQNSLRRYRYEREKHIDTSCHMMSLVARHSGRHSSVAAFTDHCVEHAKKDVYPLWEAVKSELPRVRDEARAAAAAAPEGARTYMRMIYVSDMMKRQLEMKGVDLSGIKLTETSRAPNQPAYYHPLNVGHRNFMLNDTSNRTLFEWVLGYLRKLDKGYPLPERIGVDVDIEEDTGLRPREDFADFASAAARLHGLPPFERTGFFVYTDNKEAKAYAKTMKFSRKDKPPRLRDFKVNPAYNRPPAVRPFGT